MRRIGVDRLPALHERELLEAQIAVDPAQARAAGRQVGIEQEPRAVDRAVVVQLDRLLQVVERLDRPVRRLLRDGVVEPRRRVVRIELLGDGVLALVERARFSS